MLNLHNLVDIHYSTTSITGWPKIRVQVFYQDMFGRNELCNSQHSYYLY